MEIGEYQQAQQIFEENYNVEKDILGERNPSILKTKRQIARCVYENNHSNKQQAIKLLQEVFDTQTVLLGKNHPDTLGTKSMIDKINNKE